MTTAVTAQMSFEERLKEKLKSDIGALMTDEDLKKLVDKAMQDLFFSQRKVQQKDSRGWGYEEVTKPAVFVEVVKELMEPAVRKALADWMAAHPEEMKQAIDAVLTTNFLVAVKNILLNLTSGPYTQLVTAIGDQFKQHIDRHHGGQY